MAFILILFYAIGVTKLSQALAIMYICRPVKFAMKFESHGFFFQVLGQSWLNLKIKHLSLPNKTIIVT